MTNHESRCSCGSIRTSANISKTVLAGIEIAAVLVQCKNCGREETSFLIDNEEQARKIKSGRWVPRDELSDYIALAKKVAGEAGLTAVRETVLSKVESMTGHMTMGKVKPSSPEYEFYKSLGKAITDIMSDPPTAFWAASWHDKADTLVLEFYRRDQEEIDKNGYSSPKRESCSTLEKLLKEAGCSYIHYAAVAFLMSLTSAFKGEFQKMKEMLKEGKVQVIVGGQACSTQTN